MFIQPFTSPPHSLRIRPHPGKARDLITSDITFDSVAVTNPAYKLYRPIIYVQPYLSTSLFRSGLLAQVASLLAPGSLPGDTR